MWYFHLFHVDSVPPNVTPAVETWQCERPDVPIPFGSPWIRSHLFE